MDNIQNKKVAILATNGFEQSELESPMNFVKKNGATVHVISPESGTIKGWSEGNWTEGVRVDKTIDEVKADDYNALILPGGVINPDSLRKNTKAVDFVRTFFKQHKPVAAICHGPQMLIEADVVKGRRMTSYDSIKTDLTNAGANWVDEACVVDEGLVTSRTPHDLDSFNEKLVEEIKEGKHEMQTA